MNKISESLLFILKCLVKVRDINDLVDLRLFYDWYFSELSYISKVRIWQTSYWKKIRSKILQNNSFCSVCGSNENLVLQHVISYPGKFVYINKFVSELRFLSWQKFRKFYKLYGCISLYEALPYYKKYLFLYFSRLLDYFSLIHVRVYCKSCAYKEDIFYSCKSVNRYLVLSEKSYLSILSDFYENKQNEHTHEERPKGRTAVRG